MSFRCPSAQRGAAWRGRPPWQRATAARPCRSRRPRWPPLRRTRDPSRSANAPCTEFCHRGAHARREPRRRCCCPRCSGKRRCRPLSRPAAAAASAPRRGRPPGESARPGSPARPRHPKRAGPPRALGRARGWKVLQAEATTRGSALRRRSRCSGSNGSRGCRAGRPRSTPCAQLAHTRACGSRSWPPAPECRSGSHPECRRS
mmetsp:Transcript_91975/g.274462  ORF Transcript_91975/g.274462 Transcript_91975/m.274462 type:complete len:203 (-) Transcript_91975:3-611(-)